jgi:hypothetical protein
MNQEQLLDLELDPLYQQKLEQALKKVYELRQQLKYSEEQQQTSTSE